MIQFPKVRRSARQTDDDFFDLLPMAIAAMRFTRKRLLCSVAALGLLVGVAGHAKGQLYDYVTIDVPGATNTYARAINDLGEIAGYFVDASNITHGFRRDLQGNFTTLDAPGASATLANGISASGKVVGSFTGADGVAHGYVQNGDGSFTTIDAPGPGVIATALSGINNLDQILASYFDDAFHLHCILIQANGDITICDVQGASDTVAGGINDSSQIVVSTFINGAWQGYLRDTDSTYTAVTNPGWTVSYCNGLNNARQIVGSFAGADGVDHGYVQNSDGSYIALDVLLDVPPAVQATTALSINVNGEIVGTYRQGGLAFGYFAFPHP